MTIQGNSKISPYHLTESFVLSDTQLNALVHIHQSFAAMASERASALLRADVKIIPERLEQIPFSLFLHSQEKQSCYALLDVEPLNGTSALSLTVDISLAVIDRLLGGSGETPVSSRPFNELEMAINRKLINLFLLSLREAWKPVLEIGGTIDEIGTNPTEILAIAKNDKCLIGSFRFHFLNTNGLFFVVIPSQSLKPFAENLQLPRNPGTVQTSPKKLNMNWLNLEIKALVGSTKISRDDLVNLQHGDILRLEQNMEDPINILIQGSPLLKGRPGLTGINKGVALIK